MEDAKRSAEAAKRRRASWRPIATVTKREQPEFKHVVEKAGKQAHQQTGTRVNKEANEQAKKQRKNWIEVNVA